MNMSYCLVFLLGLLPFSTLATATQTTGGTALNIRDDEGQKLLTDRYHIRGWSKNTRTRQSDQQPVQKSDLEDGDMQESVEKVEETTPDQDKSSGFPNGEKPEMQNNKEKQHGEKPSSVAGITKEKSEEMPKYKSSGCLTGEKMTNLDNRNVDEINEWKN